MDEQQLRQHYAGIAMNGILSSPRWSSVLMDTEERSEDTVDQRAKGIVDLLVGIAWGIANGMIIEGRERGFVGVPPGHETAEDPESANEDSNHAIPPKAPREGALRGFRRHRTPSEGKEPIAS